MAVNLSAYVPAALYPQEDSWYSFLLEAESTPWNGDQPVARPLLTHRTTQTQNKSTQTSMPRVGFQPTIPVFE
jgi:hypothetical protein